MTGKKGYSYPRDVASWNQRGHTTHRRSHARTPERSRKKNWVLAVCAILIGLFVVLTVVEACRLVKVNSSIKAAEETAERLKNEISSAQKTLDRETQYETIAQKAADDLNMIDGDYVSGGVTLNIRSSQTANAEGR